MSLTFVRAPDHFVATFHGTMTPEDLKECARRMAEVDADVPDGQDRIADLSPVTTFNVNFLAVSDLAKERRERRYNRLVKSALVAGRPVAVGFARMYQTILNNPDVDVRIFASLDEARAWLAQDGSEPPPSDPRRDPPGPR